MERRWRTGFIVLSIGLIVSLAWGFYHMTARRQAETILSARYQQNFFDALGHIENVEVLLSKALVSSSPRENIRYLTELWQQAFSAQANLNSLPLQQGTLMRTSRFLTQLGDFSFVTSQKIAEGRPVSDDDLDGLRRLHGEVTALGLELNTVAQQSAEGRMPWEEMKRQTRLTLNPLSKRLRAPEQADGFARVDQQMQEMPTLVYDGPFSDHITTRTAKGIAGEPVDAFAARSIGLNFVPVSDEHRDTYVTENVTETRDGAPISAWSIRVQQPSNSRVQFILDVAKEGGHVLWMLNTRDVESPLIKLDDAVEVARMFLEERGFANFEVTYPVVESGRAIIPFALVVDEVLVYPDQLKVTVALDRGEVVGFDALQYYMAHHDRSFVKAKISPDEARERVAPDLNVDHVRLALIPMADLREVLAYEVKGRLGTDLYHIYINAMTGDEEQILRIVEHDDAGLLAM